MSIMLNITLDYRNTAHCRTPPPNSAHVPYRIPWSAMQYCPKCGIGRVTQLACQKPHTIQKLTLHSKYYTLSLENLADDT